ncbi:cryptochrome/photolyase family protein [Daejeonella lutea]|uniref:Deoxyribodipyrimidine photo-lyase n=1 Tax=Daejeonella lutea TaxID=572036 RepID=A0A1T5AGQ3_9SPHI|nr:deoxyribodipyrimidine photo-lyase [Daejeonella lutea]SKB34116.1 deoxyribodipyrimidine photo-lyase [Daejeonella lutea]
MKREVSIFWFRRDLRLVDNTALYYALSSKYPVLPVFIFDPQILDKLTEKHDARVAFIHQTICDIDTQLRRTGSSLYVLHSPVLDAFKQIFENFNVREIFSNHDYEPYAILRDNQIRKLANSKGINFQTFKDQVIFERSEILKSDGSPYTVFTPYAKKWRQKYNENKPETFQSEKQLAALLKIDFKQIPSLKELGFTNLHPTLLPLKLDAETIGDYHKTRNLPGIAGTSQASPYLRFGTLSIRHLVSLAFKWNESWLNELIWREFFMMILFHFPHVVDQSFKKKYDNIPWRNNEHEFELWCKGETGYPIVDAGMRQLNEIGWMHNRVRMIVAGFLTKHLLIDWRWGEAYFAQKLIDYELSSNNGNWQWAAGSGCDSAPYFRIFNPTSQTLKFDPKLHYIKTWIKDFNKYHLVPIVEHEFARKRALDVYKKALNDD